MGIINTTFNPIVSLETFLIVHQCRETTKNFELLESLVQNLNIELFSVFSDATEKR